VSRSQNQSYLYKNNKINQSELEAIHATQVTNGFGLTDFGCGKYGKFFKLIAERSKKKTFDIPLQTRFNRQ